MTSIASIPPGVRPVTRWTAFRHQLIQQGRQLEVGNVATLGLGEMACRVATLVAFVHLARTLTPAGYGQIELTLAILMILTLVVDQGLGTFGTREVARNPGQARSWASRIIVLQLIAAGVVLIGTVLVCTFAPFDPTLKVLLVGYSASLLGFPFLLQWLFQGLRQMGKVALPQVVRWGLFTALVFVFVRDANDILVIPIFEIIAVSAGAALFLCYFSRWKRAHPAQSADASSSLPGRRLLIKDSLPIGGSNLIWAMRMYLPTVLVGIFLAQTAVGFFGTAHRVLMAFQTLVNVYFLNFLPLLTEKMHHSPGQGGAILRRSSLLAGAACVIMALGVTAAAPSVIRLIFGEVYARSESPRLLSLVIWVIPIFVLRNHARSALLSIGRQRAEMTCALIGLTGLLAGGTLLTAFYGTTGAAWAMIGSELLATALSWAAVKHYWRPGD